MRSLALVVPYVTLPGSFWNSCEGKPRLCTSKEARDSLRATYLVLDIGQVISTRCWGSEACSIASANTNKPFNHSSRHYLNRI